MAPKGVKAAKLAKRTGSEVKVVEWVTKEYSRGSRDIAIEVSPIRRGKKKVRRYSSGREEDGKTSAALHEDLPPSMDVDEEAYWTEEPVAEEKRVSILICPHSVVSDMSVSLSRPTWRTLYLGLVLTWIAFLVLRVFQLQQDASCARLLHLNGGALIVSLHLYSARTAAENHTGNSLSTGFRGGQGCTSFHHGCGRLG